MNNRLKKFSVVLIIIYLFINYTACVNTYSSYVNLTKTTYAPFGENNDASYVNKPSSSYNLGSAKILAGKNVIISLFVDTPGKRWTYKRRQEELKKLSRACDYLTNKGSEYSQDIEFVYDWNTDFSLLKSSNMKLAADNTGFEDEIDKEFDVLTKSKIDYDALLRKYSADNVFTIIFLDFDGRSYAICYDGEDNPKESVVIFKDTNEATYAHEILHLYGAHDYYSGAEYSNDATRELKKRFPKDIMLTTFLGNIKNNTISDLTAYHIGWTDSAEIVTRFDELRR